MKHHKRQIGEADLRRAAVMNTGTLRQEALALFRRLAADRCDGCGKIAQDLKVTDVDWQGRERYIFCLCDSCLNPGVELDITPFLLSEELAIIMNGGYPESLLAQLPTTGGVQ